jgi:hypothetical protein
VLKRSCPCTYTPPTASPLVTTGGVLLRPCMKQETYEEKKWLYSNLVAIRLISLQMQSRQRITSGLFRNQVPKGTEFLVASHIKTDAPFFALNAATRFFDLKRGSPLNWPKNISNVYEAEEIRFITSKGPSLFRLDNTFNVPVVLKCNKVSWILPTKAQLLSDVPEMKKISAGVPPSRSSITFRYLSKLRLSYSARAI